MNTENLYRSVLQTLKSISLEDYSCEETQLQPYLESAISGVLDSEFPGKYEIKMSVGGKNRPRVDLLGTNFWPDIEISKNSLPLLAVEVKLAGKSLATAVSATIGQCLIYRLKYEYVIGFIRNQARINPQYNEFDRQLDDALNKLGFPLIIR